ncbi:MULTISPECIES: transketolase [unclassified Sphingobium]|uniref:transketolase n=1 Tax=unclassified Sphingobium TaxID=2611147 RepID=UPI0022257868|nr:MULTISPECIES: transketolase [unclassified Sphingobium]MCW2395069.1 transketolase [Sphingobium sp. B8D3B]MCW2418583.1 transketolase [Sphingobium sp. B8D3C]
MSVTEKRLADAIRVLSMDGVQAANSGHPGMPMGMADVATVLFKDYLKFDPAAPGWHDRDRFVLSAGHGSMLIYALLHLSGYARPTMADIRNFRQMGSPCAGHPENFELAGVEATTGPLGQGLAMAVGMAMAERHLNATFGDPLVDHRTWVIAGDGCLMEGINHEAIGLAGHLGLGRLNVLWDDNKITIDGAVSLSSSEDVLARYAATGWHVTACDGHDFGDIRRAMDEAMADPRPSLIACRTRIGQGAPNKAGSHKVHGSPLGEDEITATREALGWDLPPFELPDDVKAAWAETGTRGKKAHADWQGRLASHSDKDEFERRMAGKLPAGFSIQSYLDGLIAEPKKVATRKASEMALDAINVQLPEMFGGSADLTGSNLTQSKDQKVAFSRDDYSGRYVYYGIREFGMSAAMNGIALHGGMIPYGGTFLVFSDYARNAIRMSALQQLRVVYVMTHDSIGLGEDGPTHQPIEHVMSLRMIPNLEVFRPADTIETAECWALALQQDSTPSLLALSRQNLPQLRTDASENLCAKGAYTLVTSGTAPKVVLIATGSEVEIAVNAAKLLEAQGVATNVVSMPSMSRFLAQEEGYRASVLPQGALRVSIEAGTTFGWATITGTDGINIGIDSFGLSAPAQEIYDHFGLNAQSVAARVSAALV